MYGSLLGYALMFQGILNVNNKDFEDKCEQAVKKYKNARNYPRKIKKCMKKEALADYNFYKSCQCNYSDFTF